MAQIFPSDVSPGSNGNAADYNAVKNIMVDINGVAGEAIDTSSNPRPVFLSSNGKYLMSDANDTSRLQFDGFALSTAAAEDDPVFVQDQGIAYGFTGLTKGAVYYVSNAVGGISSTKGTFSIPVGIATSTTAIRLFPVHKMRAGFISSIDSGVVASVNEDFDNVITLGFQPRKITLRYWLLGYQGGSVDDNVERAGIAEFYFAGTTGFRKDYVLWEATGGNAAELDETIADYATVTLPKFGYAGDEFVSHTPIQIGSNGGLSEMQIGLSIPSITNTGFTIRVRMDGDDSPNRGRAQVSWIAEA